MRKKILSFVLSLCLILSVCTPALADTPAQRVVLGINNSPAAVERIYGYFRIEQGTVDQLYITNEEEREILAGYIPLSKIGSVALSSVYIDTDRKSGLTIEIYNINWVTEDMYRNALATAGIKDARVIVAAASPVSGTGALAGIYKAYEDISGTTLDADAKDVAAQEIVVTGELQDVIGDKAPEIIADMKDELGSLEGKPDDEVKEAIENTADKYDVKLTGEQVTQILELLKRMMDLNIDADIIHGIAEEGKGIMGFFKAIGDFFKGIGDWFAGLFGGGVPDEPPMTEEEAVTTVLPSDAPEPEVTAEASDELPADDASEAPPSEDIIPQETPTAVTAEEPAASQEPTATPYVFIFDDPTATPTPDPTPEPVPRTLKAMIVDIGTYKITAMPEGKEYQEEYGTVILFDRPEDWPAGAEKRDIVEITYIGEVHPGDPTVIDGVTAVTLPAGEAAAAEAA